MLVKELRQGIQSGAFAWTFVGLQVAMFLIMSWLVTLAGEEASPIARGFDGVVWAAIGFAMVLLVPLRGLGAIAAERTGSNLDLVRLTHLSATRIVVGKWLALVSQSLLLATAVLPYLVLRYFFGGVDVLSDLESFAWMAAAAMLVAAAAVALSTLPLWLRIATCVVGGFVALPLTGAILEQRFFSGGFRTGVDPVLVRLGFATAMALYLVVCLEFAAGRIAPPAENHAARKRLLALAAVAAWVVIAALGTRPAAVATLVIVGPLLACYGIGALVERPSRLATVAAPFGRRGPAGSVAARLLTPGWATGLVFVAVAWAAFSAGWTAFANRFAEPDAPPGLGTTLPCLLAATLVFPVPLVARLPRAKLPLLLYALPQLVCFMVFVWSGAVGPVGRPWLESSTWFIVLPFPLAGLLTYVTAVDSAAPAGLDATFVAAAIGTTIVALVAVVTPWFREMRALGSLLAAARGGEDA